jgi:hypothetical protein
VVDATLTAITNVVVRLAAFSLIAVFHAVLVHEGHGKQNALPTS